MRPLGVKETLIPDSTLEYLESLIVSIMFCESLGPQDWTIGNLISDHISWFITQSRGENQEFKMEQNI